MSRTLPRARSFSPGKSVCEMTALICGEDTECFSSLEAGILAQRDRMSTPKNSFFSAMIGEHVRPETSRLPFEVQLKDLAVENDSALGGVARGFRCRRCGGFFPLHGNQL